MTALYNTNTCNNANTLFKLIFAFTYQLPVLPMLANTVSAVLCGSAGLWVSRSDCIIKLIIMLSLSRAATVVHCLCSAPKMRREGEGETLRENAGDMSRETTRKSAHIAHYFMCSILWINIFNGRKIRAKRSSC